MRYEPLVTISTFTTSKGEFTKIKLIRQSMIAAHTRQRRDVASELGASVSHSEIRSLKRYLATFTGQTFDHLSARGF
jgi:hypothetical protein